MLIVGKIMKANKIKTCNHVICFINVNKCSINDLVLFFMPFFFFFCALNIRLRRKSRIFYFAQPKYCVCVKSYCLLLKRT